MCKFDRLGGVIAGVPIPNQTQGYTSGVSNFSFMPQVLVDRTLCLWCLWFPIPPFFNIDFFFMYTTFCNFLCITVWHIYNKNNQTV